MRAIIQRVSQAQVTVNSNICGAINNGLLVLLGITHDDTIDDINWLVQKIINLRIFNSAQNAMNLSVQDVDGNILLISQFTLYATSKKGNRPSFIKSAKPIIAEPLYNETILAFNKALNKNIETGIFGADMKVSLCNDGPVTIIFDTQNKDIF